jgi:hypothetical protein
MTLSPEQISPLVRPRTLDLSGFRHLEPSSAPHHKRSRRAMECSRRCARSGHGLAWCAKSAYSEQGAVKRIGHGKESEKSSV